MLVIVTVCAVEQASYCLCSRAEVSSPRARRIGRCILHPCTRLHRNVVFKPQLLFIAAACVGDCASPRDGGSQPSRSDGSQHAGMRPRALVVSSAFSASQVLLPKTWDAMQANCSRALRTADNTLQQGNAKKRKAQEAALAVVDDAFRRDEARNASAVYNRQSLASYTRMSNLLQQLSEQSQALIDRTVTLLLRVRLRSHSNQFISPACSICMSLGVQLQRDEFDLTGWPETIRKFPKLLQSAQVTSVEPDAAPDALFRQIMDTVKAVWTDLQQYPQLFYDGSVNKTSWDERSRNILQWSEKQVHFILNQFTQKKIWSSHVPISSRWMPYISSSRFACTTLLRPFQTF